MLSIQKAASNKIGLGYEFSSPNIASSSKIFFVSPANDNDAENNEAKTEIASQNLDNVKSILRAPPKVEKKKTRNPRNKANNKMSQQKKPHFCHHYETSRHTRPNCYKWLATEQSNSVLSSGGQDHTPPSLGPLRDLLKALMFLLNLNGFNFSPLPLEQRFTKKKGPSLKPKVWKEKGSK